MSKAQLVEAIQNERVHLEALIAPLSEDQMNLPILEGQRSIKDILAHIAVWEQRCIQWIVVSVGGGVPERPEPGYRWEDIDRLNERTYLENKDRPIADVLADSARSYLRLLEKVRSLTEEDLSNPDRFAWTEGEQLAWFVGANSFEHYHEHGDEINAWLHQNS